METIATKKQLNEALNHVNKQFSNNIIFKNGPEQISKNRVRFTLTVKETRGPGGRVSSTGKRIKAACWHVHGEFFEYLFSQGVTLIKSSFITMQDNSDNWKDSNIGSHFTPMNYSEACDCN